MIDEKRKSAASKVVEFIESNKQNYIDYQHWISGSSTIVYPISNYYCDDGKSVEITFQLKNCDARNWRGFENVLKRKFPYVKSAYYCQYDGSCPNVYKIKLKVD